MHGSVRLLARAGVAALTLASLPAVAAGFEGVITTQMTFREGKTIEVVYKVKGSRTRFEAGSPETQEMGAAVMIFDGDAGTTTTLMPNRKMAMVMNYRDMAKGMPEKDHKMPKMTKTGKKETVAGYTCEHWLFGDKQEMDACLAKGLGFMGMGGQPGAGTLAMAMPALDQAKLKAALAAHPELKELVEGGAFPLKAESTDRGFKMVVTKIEKKSLSEDLFKVPPDYQLMNMGNMMQQMQQMHGTPPGK